MSSVVIDSNIFTLLIVGMINPKKINQHKRTSIYNEKHFTKLTEILGRFDEIYTSPNILTEIDNLLNKTAGEDRYKYFQIVKQIIEKSTEKYFASKEVTTKWFFESIGLTDSVVLMLSHDAQLLISGDSEVCDYARSMDIKLFDFKQYVNQGIMEYA